MSEEGGGLGAQLARQPAAALIAALAVFVGLTFASAPYSSETVQAVAMRLSPVLISVGAAFILGLIDAAWSARPIRNWGAAYIVSLAAVVGSAGAGGAIGRLLEWFVLDWTMLLGGAALAVTVVFAPAFGLRYSPLAMIFSAIVAVLAGAAGAGAALYANVFDSGGAVFAIALAAAFGFAFAQAAVAEYGRCYAEGASRRMSGALAANAVIGPSVLSVLMLLFGLAILSTANGDGLEWRVALSVGAAVFVGAVAGPIATIGAMSLTPLGMRFVEKENLRRQDRDRQFDDFETVSMRRAAVASAVAAILAVTAVSETGLAGDWLLRQAILYVGVFVVGLIASRSVKGGLAIVGVLLVGEAIASYVAAAAFGGDALATPRAMQIVHVLSTVLAAAPVLYFFNAWRHYAGGFGRPGAAAGRALKRHGAAIVALIVMPAIVLFSFSASGDWPFARTLALFFVLQAVVSVFIAPFLSSVIAKQKIAFS